MAITLAACAEQKGAPSERTQPKDGPKRGDVVVVERAAAEFFQGRVLAREGDSLRVQDVVQRRTVTIALADAYRVSTERSPLTAGAYAICGLPQDQWLGCHVLEASRATWRVRLVDGRQLDTDPTRVVRPSALTELNVRRRFERWQREHAFAEAVQRAGDPERPSGWQPAPRERVLGKQGAGWFSGRVHEIEDDAVLVRWDADRQVVRLERRHVVPEPPYQAPFERGRFALTRPETSAQPWWPVEIVAVAPPEATVSDGGGRRRTVELRDLLPLE